MGKEGVGGGQRQGYLNVSVCLCCDVCSWCQHLLLTIFSYSVNLTWRKRHDKGDKRRQTVDIFEDLPEEMEGERGSGEKESPKEQGKDKQESKEQEHKEKEKDQQDDKQEKKEEIPQQQEQQQEQEKQEKEQRQQQTQQQQLANDFLSLVDSEPFHDVEIFVGTPEVCFFLFL